PYSDGMDLEDMFRICGRGLRPARTLNLLIISCMFGPYSPHARDFGGCGGAFDLMNHVYGTLMVPGIHDFRDGREPNFRGPSCNMKISILRRRIRFLMCLVNRKVRRHGRSVLEIFDEVVLEYDFGF